MSERRRKAITMPGEGEKPKPRRPILPVFSDRDRDERDVTKPVGFDAAGKPLYAPRGITFRIPWGS